MIYIARFSGALVALAMFGATPEERLADSAIQANRAVVAEQKAHEAKSAHLKAVADEKGKALEALCESEGKKLGFNQVEFKLQCVVWQGQALQPPNTTTNR